MKHLKLFIILIVITFLSNCGQTGNNQTPDKIFRAWYKYAKNRNYSKMFELEWFRYSNIIYAYNKYNSPKTWDSATRDEQKNFVKLYKKVLKNLLNKKNNDLYEALLRLKDTYQIKITRYSVNLLKNSADLWIAGDYPGEEKIKLKRINNKWFLINPFGYHSYLPVTRTLLKQKK